MPDDPTSDALDPRRTKPYSGRTRAQVVVETRPVDGRLRRPRFPGDHMEPAPCAEPTRRIQIPTPSSPHVVPSLLVVEGGEPGLCFDLATDQPSFVVGRGELADVLIDDETVSRSHATITFDGLAGRSRVARVIDLNSRNGTFVNGVPIDSACLVPGDKLQVGRVVLRFDLLDRADRGEGRHPSFRPSTWATAPALTALDEAAFERALSVLWLAFQPIVSSTRHAIVGWEALVRTDEPTLRSPDKLLAAAEALSRLHDVGRAVRASAARFVERLPEAAYLAVNLHPVDLEDPDLVDPDAPLSRVAARVVLELTERASIERLGGVERRIEQLRQLGYRIAIDDVGAGYAGLGTVTRIVPDMLKVDRSIVHELHKSTTKAKVIQSLSTLCADLGVQMVVEGVETLEEMVAARDLGCDLMQGYWFARPHDREPDSRING
ncbi:MAG: EAL domain-containing protein [Deltaproteobacteria bacterium]|nr:EAL domain-containing protein [Deltaproteobacteria bacterium]